MNLAVRIALSLIVLALPAAAIATSEQVGVSNHLEADGTTTQVHEVLVPAPVDQVWQAVSTPSGWMTWAVPFARTTDDPDVIETNYDLAGNAAQSIRQHFLARIPNRLLVYRTVKAPADFPHWEEYRHVTSVFELQAEANGTRVRLYSAGYPDSEAGRELLKFFSAGNADALQHLQLRFADGPRAWK